jgi:hypothetical protein
MQRRGAKGREGYAEGRLMAKCDFKVRKYCIYTYFFLSAGWLNWFGSISFRL